MKQEYQDANETSTDNSSRIKGYFSLFPKRQLSRVKTDKVLKPELQVTCVDTLILSFPRDGTAEDRMEWLHPSTHS